MKTFVCQECRHIAFNEAPVDCPVCGVAIENFEDDPGAITRPADLDHPSDGEKKHIPLIHINRECTMNHKPECININIQIGEIEHVMESEHFIKFIDLYVDKRYISRVVFTPKRIHPATRIHLNLTSGKFRAIANCNVHGSWTAKVNLNGE